VRLHPDGELDAAFGDPGTAAGLPGRVLLPSLLGAPDLADTVFSSIALQGDGKIVVAGTCGGQLLVARFTAEGGFDGDQFGPDGFRTLQLPRGQISVGRVLIQPDGKIVVVGRAISPSSSGSSTDVTNIVLVRYLPDGELDGTFGDPLADNDLRVRKGWTLINIKNLGFEGANDGAVDSQGRILAVGGTAILSGFAGNLLMVRTRPDGLLDQGFSDGRGNPGGVNPCAAWKRPCQRLRP
jgi:uncharacterized delta-60 repeat protein